MCGYELFNCNENCTSPESGIERVIERLISFENQVVATINTRTNSFTSARYSAKKHLSKFEKLMYVRFVLNPRPCQILNSTRKIHRFNLLIYTCKCFPQASQDHTYSSRLNLINSNKQPDNGNRLHLARHKHQHNPPLTGRPSLRQRHLSRLRLSTRSLPNTDILGLAIPVWLVRPLLLGNHFRGLHSHRLGKKAALLPH